VSRATGSSAPELRHRQGRLPRTPTLTLILGVVAGCAAPPREPLPVTRVRTVKIVPAAAYACPGQTIKANYDVVLDDGSQRRIDAFNLGVVDRVGVNAEARGDGDWNTEADPLVSVMTGYHLRAALHDDRAIAADTTIIPKYDCGRGFYGLNAAAAPYSGPDVSVRVSQFRSPFYDSLVLIAVSIVDRPTLHVILAPGDMKRGAVHLSADGRGGRSGAQGAAGASGAAACEDGGDGTDGLDGESGGSGGRFSVYVQSEHQGLLDLIVATNSGGPGGPGGRGGYGGSPGAAVSASGQPCSPRAGRGGSNGHAGGNGDAGPPWRVRAVPLKELWELSPSWANDTERKAISALIDFTAKHSRP
jgi:hypothetical protein